MVDDLGWLPGWIGENEFLGRSDFKIGDPDFKGLNFLGRQLLFWRHVGVGIDLDDLIKRTFFGVSGNEGGVGLATFERGLNGAEVEAAFLFHTAVALGAVVNDDRVDL